jgi:hypothetical protein
MTDQANCNSCSERLDSDDLNSDGYGPRNTLLCARCRKLAAAQHRHGWSPIMQWEDGWEGLRLASRAPVPWDDRNVVMLRITHDGGIRVAHTVTGKVRMLQDATPGDMVLVAWPGGRRQDMFIVDNRKAALRALQTTGR